jgi:hypothetical protein
MKIYEAPSCFHENERLIPRRVSQAGILGWKVLGIFWIGIFNRRDAGVGQAIACPTLLVAWFTICAGLVHPLAVTATGTQRLAGKMSAGTSG